MGSTFSTIPSPIPSETAQKRREQGGCSSETVGVPFGYVEDLGAKPTQLSDTYQRLQVLCVIPARFSSTRLPGKPLADIAGKPMIQRVYERAR